MKLSKNAEKNLQSTNNVSSVSQKKNEILGLKSFQDKYPNNSTTQLVFFENGMKEVESPFTSIIGLSKQIAETDKHVIDIYIKENSYDQLEEFVMHRRNAVKVSFAARVNFLGRSLAMNIDQKIQKIITSSSFTRIYCNSMIDFIMDNITHGYYSGVASPAFSNTDNSDIDYLTTYSFNTSVIPSIVATIYDKYDEQIVESVSHITKSKETAEEIHMDILYKIMPAFEVFKSQLEWMSYMLRSEAANIYRPMGLLEADNILDEYWLKEHQAFLKKMEEERKESKDCVDNFQNNMVEAAKDNPNIKTTTF